MSKMKRPDSGYAVEIEVAFDISIFEMKAPFMNISVQKDVAEREASDRIFG